MLAQEPPEILPVPAKVGAVRTEGGKVQGLALTGHDLLQIVPQPGLDPPPLAVPVGLQRLAPGGLLTAFPSR